MQNDTSDWKYDASVIRVIDGDTIEASIDLGFSVSIKQTFRLYGVNAPELHGISKPEGEKAKRFLIECLEGKTVVIETRRDSTEKFGRYLATIWVDEKNINNMLVESGNAVPYFGGPRV